MPKSVKIGDLATFITSKNAGPFLLTVDIVFLGRSSLPSSGRDGCHQRRDGSEAVRYSAGAHAEGGVLRPGDAIKVTFKRPVGSGAIGETDVYGAQQHVPVMQYEIPWDESE